MELRHVMRIPTMSRNSAQVAAILRQQGMRVYDDLRGIPPSVLTWQDDINGAGARTFIWNDSQSPAPWTPESSRTNYTSLPEAFEHDNVDSRPLVRLQQMYDAGLISLGEMREEAQRVINEVDSETEREARINRVGLVGWDRAALAHNGATAHNSTTAFNTTRDYYAIEWPNGDRLTWTPEDMRAGAAASNNTTPKIEIHERPPVRLVRLED